MSPARARLLAALVAACLVLTAPRAARADCMSACMSEKGCGLQYESSRVQPGYCSIAKSDCEVRCRRGEEASATYGAIAFSPATGAWGDAFGHPSRAGAEQRALGECGRRARDCAVAVWFKDQCGAVASAGGGIWASGLGRTRAAASADAMTDCRQRGARSCETRHAVCSR
jgi:uncharacterized protein DUF4189